MFSTNDPLLIFKLSVFFTAIGYIPFCFATWRSKTRPTLSSWIAWLVMDTVVYLSMKAGGENATQLLAYIAGIISVLAVCAIRRATMGWGWFDTICVVVTGIAVVGWAKSGNPAVAIFFSMIAAVVSSLPVLKNALENPQNEVFLGWLLITTGGVLGIAAITNWTVIGAVTPIVFGTLQTLMLVLVARKFKNDISDWMNLILFRD